MVYKVSFNDVAAQLFDQLDNSARKPIAKAIDKLEQLKDPRQRLLPLSGALAGFYKLRVGDYRLLFEIKDKQLLLIAFHLGHRSTVYKTASKHNDPFK